MELTFDGTVVEGGPDAREQFYDARGYGRPCDGDVELTPVEAAHLLFRGDVETVTDQRPEPDRGTDGLDFQAFLASAAVSEVSFFVYKDLRDRGFYLSPGAVSDGGRDGTSGTGAGRHEFAVYPRGLGPWDETVAYRVRAVSEREDVTAAGLQAHVRQQPDSNATSVLVVVDEESEVTYLELSEPAMQGATDTALDPAEGVLLSDRVLVADPPPSLYERGFYGQPLDADGPVQLSLVEAAHLVECDRLQLRADGGETLPTDRERVLDRGRTVEGARFDRRLRTYSTLREAGIVPKTGFKFGADFRTYDAVTSVDDLGHSECLVRVLPPSHTFSPRDLALYVRLAHGVRKQMVFARPTGDGIDWLGVERLTP